MTSNTMWGLVAFLGASLALGYFPMLSRLSLAFTSPYPKPDIRRRLFAANVDGLLVISSWLYYRASDVIWIVLLGVGYLLVRDAIIGRSIGKFLAGLVVINLETGQPGSFKDSARRNILFLLPGANLVAVVLETHTMMKDPQGQRLGDKLAQTQVVEGFGIKDLAESFVQWWADNAREVVNGPIRRPEDGPGEVRHQWHPEVSLSFVCRRRVSRPGRRLTPGCTRRRPRVFLS